MSILHQSPLFHILTMASVVLIVLCNIITYRCKFALRKKGFRVGFFSRHMDDYPNLKAAIAFENDPAERARLELLQRQMKMIWIFFPLAMILLVVAVVLVMKR